MASPLSPRDSHSLIQAYQTILQEDPTNWTLYPQLAKHMPTSLEKSHVFLRGAWEALRRQEYKTSQDLATQAHQADPSRFSFYLIDLELLRTQKKTHLIPSKLQEIGRLFEEKALPAQAVKAYKRHARLLPSIDTYEKVIALYTQAGKQAKALEWTRQLAKLKPAPQLEEPVEKKQQAPSQPKQIQKPPGVKSALPPQPEKPNTLSYSRGKATSDQEPTERKEPPGPQVALKQSFFSRLFGSTPPPVPALAFGKALWEEHLGSVGAEPPLPRDINEILQGPCPFWPDKKVQETHLLVLIPETVNGKPLTLKSLGDLVKKPLKGNPTQYIGLHLGQYQDPPAPKSHWALLTTDVIPGSRSKSYKDQQALIETHNQKSRLPYQVPNVLDVAVCLFMHQIRTGNRLYTDSPRTYTSCQEKCNKDWQLAVGGFARGGLDVYSGFWADDSYGVGGLRKFPR